MEKNEQKAMELSESLDQAEIIIGDGSDRQVLQEEGLMNAGAVIILTGSDEENIMISLFAGSQKSQQGYYQNQSFVVLLHAGGKRHRKHNIPPFAYRQPNNKICQRQAKLNGQFGAQSLPHSQRPSRSAGVFGHQDFCGLIQAFEGFEHKPNLIIACILRDNNVITPHGDQTIEAGDKVIVVTTNEFLDDLNDILN